MSLDNTDLPIDDATEVVDAPAADAPAAVDATAPDSAEGGDVPPAVDPETGEILDPAAAAVDAEALIAEAAPVVDNPANRPGKWFVVHTQSGYEKKVKQ